MLPKLRIRIIIFLMMFKILKRNSLNRLIFLLPVRISDEILPEDKVRMLCCTEKADLVTTLISRSTFEIIKSFIRELEKASKKYAILGIEVRPQEYVPVPVYIDSEHLMALENIAEHAINRKIMPLVVKKYVTKIIALGDIKSKEIIENYILSDNIDSNLSSHELLGGLEGAGDNYLSDAPIPIYKAQLHFPAVVLKKIEATAQNENGLQRVLILDSDGDLVIGKVPIHLLESEERELDTIISKGDLFGCITYTREKDGYIFNHVILNRLQQNALETILQQYEKTGSGERPIPLYAREVLSRASIIFKVSSY